MKFDSKQYLKKTVFWQRCAFVVLSVFLVVVWSCCIYFCLDWFYTVSFDFSRRHIRETAIIFSIFFAYLIAGTGVDYILYQAGTAMNNYLKTDDIHQLEVAFRKQRHFWMGLALMALSVFGVVFLLIILMV